MSNHLPIRKIIHVDMDAFYASVAQMDKPELKGKAIAVGGSGKRGVISAASYEARKFGVKSAMSGKLAIKLCPHLIFVKPDFKRYRELSTKIKTIFFDYTDLVEPLSLDEAYLDVTTNKKNNPSASLIAQEIRTRIFNEVGLTASAGISINKFVAKIASDYNKPNGQKLVKPEEVVSFLETLDIRKFYGVGKVTAEKMYQKGIFTGKDLKEKTIEYLNTNFGKSGQFYYQVVRGIHLSEVKPNRILTKNKIAGKTITLKIKYSDFTQQTRSKTLPYFISDKNIILDTAKGLLYQEKLNNSVRLLGISISSLNTISYTKKAISKQLKIGFKG